ncbi:4'-phosphopantetheinyl transferase superfamily protein [Nostocoides sp. HKS02]|uniref:4'-phosphopantetheinyl transferase family protein n=1 Tax=Nostocoides sp. HKS02 TaxID=1813880 RepID=UPI0018A84D38|nr:4'-phosphopantetheinyl transferase superfamily protein [Tetrasphaera sp. HKS02]
MSNDAGELARLTALLDDHERARSRRRPDPASYVTAHALLRTVAGEWTGQRPQDIEFDRECATCGSVAHGKPVIRGHAGVYVSLSYAGELAVAAVTDVGETGVDVEQVDETDFEGFDAVTLALEEVAAFQSVAMPELAVARARVWARKESVLKASGHGLAVDPRDVVVTGPGDPAGLVHWRGDRPLRAPVQLDDVPLPQPGYAAAVAVLTEAPVELSVRS